MTKRAFDLLASTAGIAILSPVLVVFAVLVKLGSPGPVLYRGTRAGLFGRPFRIMKFRTMVVDADKIGGPTTGGDDPRVTRTGAFLRRFKLDELPQLINVVRGDMSLVGPRPEVLSEVAEYTDEQQAVLTVRPGITDWASIWNSDEGAVLEGAADPHALYKELIQPTKLELQLKYVRERTFLTDLKIIAFTAVKLLRKGWLPRDIESYGRLQPGAAAGADGSADAVRPNKFEE